MITLRDLSLGHGDCGLASLNLAVADGEIVFLLERLGLDGLFAVLSGRRPAEGGDFHFSPGPAGAAPAAFLERVEDANEFETGARVGEWIDFLCAAAGLDRASVFRTLLVCNLHESQLKKRARDLSPEVFRQIYLALCLAGGAPSIVIHDFIRGAGKGFEMKFNKLLLQAKAQGRAILYLGSDIFYASQIADRVGFVKNGRLLFEAEAADLKEMDIKGLYLQFLN